MIDKSFDGERDDGGDYVWVRVDGPPDRIVIRIGGVEGFSGMVGLLMAAGARGLGHRRFEIYPPLAPGQLAALRRLDEYASIEVTVEPDDADLLRADPAVSEPETTGLSAGVWWSWQNNHYGSAEHRPSSHR